MPQEQTGLEICGHQKPGNFGSDKRGMHKKNSIPEDVTKKILNIPDNYKRVCITPIGIPYEWPETLPKKDLKEAIVYDKFQGSLIYFLSSKRALAFSSPFTMIEIW